MNLTLFRPRLHRLFSALLILMLVAAILKPAISPAQSGRSQILIRDAEIERILKFWADPVIRAADLDPAAVKFILVQSPDLNAFVAGGQNIFIFTGLLTSSESPAEIIGVIAHELGHIRGGHLVRSRGAMQTASYESMLGAILGIGAAVLTGEGGLGTAVAAGMQAGAVSRFLSFSRVQESSADQAALDYLEKAHMNPQGLVSFMQKLEDQELLPSSQQSEYVRTHPLTRNRIDALQAGYERSGYKQSDTPELWQEQHNRMLAKLVGFITPEQVAWKYDDRDQSVAANYARSIAAYRQNRTDAALEKIDLLLKQEPDNPYFLELKGQMLTDFGHVTDAIPFYRRAVEKEPESGLIRTAYAHTLIETAQGDGPQDRAKLQEALQNLGRASKDEPRSTRIHRLMATAYGRLGQESHAKLHLAEEALLKGEIPYARRQAEGALNGLEKGSNSWLRAQDILNFIEQADKKN
ncbi:MAG: M48 family metallopeptidase [Rhodospirillales bacterium]|nr:M48 family metallopeptidase [Rhodospirillales bacterium]MCB9997197.1 M48 family metallopeptidase [Rhodospirillales bacterium]